MRFLEPDHDLVVVPRSLLCSSRTRLGDLPMPAHAHSGTMSSAANHMPCGGFAQVDTWTLDPIKCILCPALLVRVYPNTRRKRGVHCFSSYEYVSLQQPGGHSSVDGAAALTFADILAPQRQLQLACAGCSDRSRMLCGMPLPLAKSALHPLLPATCGTHTTASPRSCFSF